MEVKTPFVLFCLMCSIQTVLTYHECLKSKMRNNIGYLPVPYDCIAFERCDFTHHEYPVPIREHCPNGLFWDQENLTCNYPAYVNCLYDPCRIPNRIGYRIKGNCRQFYMCNNRSVPASCCKEGSSFDEGTGTCITDSQCLDECPVNKHVHIPGPCNRMAVPGNPNVYDETIYTNHIIRRKCAPGSAFETATCECSKNVPVQTSGGCSPTVQLRFDEQGVTDAKGNYVKNNGVVVNNGVATFDGSSSLEIPLFTNNHLGSFFEIRMRFRTPTQQVAGQQALVNNANCVSDDASVSIVVSGSRIGYTMENKNGQTYTLYLPDTDLRTDQRITYRYKNDTLFAFKDGAGTSRDGVGSIGKSECSLAIGRGRLLDNFVGSIDEFEIYQCQA